MFIHIDLESDVPIYLQLVRTIKEGIATRKIKPGDALPSVRSLAADLGVNMHTVNKAYQQLKQEELLIIHRQKGVVVSPELPAMDSSFVEQFEDQLRQLAIDALCRGMDEKMFMERCQHTFMQFYNERERMMKGE